MTPSKAPLRFLGTWRLTKCESSHPDRPCPKSRLTTFTQQADFVHYESETVWSDGHTSQVATALHIDGSPSAVTGSALADSANFSITGDSTFKAFLQKEGLDAGTYSASVSSTGRVMNERWELKDPSGSPTIWNIASERQ